MDGSSFFELGREEATVKDADYSSVRLLIPLITWQEVIHSLLMLIASALHWKESYATSTAWLSARAAVRTHHSWAVGMYQ